jgi:hypothetical protein
MAKVEDDDDLEAELDAAAEAADAEDEVPEDASDRLKPQIRKGKPGRKKKYRPGTVEAKSNVMAFGEHTESRAISSKDAAVIWDAVLQQAREQNRPPELIGISVTRLGMGAFPSEAQNLNQINGDLVCGDEHTSPGDALVRYITDVYHMPSAKSPKLYKLAFHFRTGTRNQIQAPVAELRLGDPAEIQAQRDAEARFLQQKAINEAVKGARAGATPLQGMGAPPPWPYPTPQPPGPGYQTPGYPQPQYYPPQPIPGASPELEAMRREMAAMMGAINERTRIEGLAPPVAQAPTVVVPSAEEQAAMMARTVAQTLVGLGFTPALAQKLNSPQFTPATIQAAITDPLELLDKAFEQVDRFRKLDKRMEERYAPEEDEEEDKKKALALTTATSTEITKVEVDKTVMKPIPIPIGFTGGKQIFYGERGPDESVIDYGVRLFMHNPETGAAFLGTALKGLSGSAIGQAVAGLISKGMPGMASIVQAQHAQANGIGASNGVSAPQAQTIPSPPPTWGAPKI